MDQQPFLRAIRAKPEDDLPRLVYADALEESGASERAEFIRVQVALANTPEHDPQYRLLEDREHELLGKNEWKWMGNPSVTPQEWAWHRGFVDEVIHPERSLLTLQDCLKDQVVTKLEVTEQDNDEHPVEFTFDEWSMDLRTLTLHGMTLSQRWREALDQEGGSLHSLRAYFAPAESILNIVRFGMLRDQLKSLHMHELSGSEQNQLDAEFVDWQDIPELFDQGHLKDLQLTSTMFSYQLPTEQLAMLLRSNATRNLNSLDVSYSSLGPEAYSAFDSSPAEFQSLGISGTPLASISLKQVLEAHSTQSLKSLEVNGTGSARTNLEAVANSHFWSQAERFCASQGTIQASTFELLTKSGSLNLRHLDLGGNYLRTEGVRYLCEAPWADSLTYLSLWNNYLDDESCEVMAKSDRFKNLRTLHLSDYNTDQLYSYARRIETLSERMTNNGMIELCQSPSLRNLRILNLGHTDIGHKSVDAIFNMAKWMLHSLYLHGTLISHHSVDLISQCPKLMRLNILDLSRNPSLGGRALLPLAQSPYLSPLCELDVSGIELDPFVIEAFQERLGRRFTYSG